MVLNIFSKISIFNHLPLDIIVGTLGMIIDFMDNISRHHLCQRRSPQKVVLVIDISIILYLGVLVVTSDKETNLRPRSGLVLCLCCGEVMSLCWDCRPPGNQLAAPSGNYPGPGRSSQPRAAAGQGTSSNRYLDISSIQPPQFLQAHATMSPLVLVRSAVMLGDASLMPGYVLMPA